jgi:hypothetical protein
MIQIIDIIHSELLYFAALENIFPRYFFVGIVKSKKTCYN